MYNGKVEEELPMNIESILSKLDAAFNDADLARAERVLTEGIRASVEEGDNGALLQLLNEYLGFLRETSRAEESYEIADKILSLMEGMGLKGSIPYATSLLNIANAYRAGGRMQDSLDLYNETEEIYKTSLPSDSLLLASFYNNKALLLQEMGLLSESTEALNLALPIVSKAGASFEIAVTHANLANSYIGLNNYYASEKEAKEAVWIFEETDNIDSHYASALYALGISRVRTGNVKDGRGDLERARDLMERFLGKNEFYYRITDAINQIDSCSQSPFVKGLTLSKTFYEECFKPVIDRDFADFKEKIAVGLFGRGSDCYGYDDPSSADHDWGPGFLVLVSKETYAEIGDRLTEAYNALPDEFMGCKKAPTVSGHRRRGVFVTEDYFKELLGKYPIAKEDYVIVEDSVLSTLVNGEIFTDPEGTVTRIRTEFMEGYPESLLYLKIAESMSKASQATQYNYSRMLSRNDKISAGIMLADGLKEAMKLAHFLENKYPPHDKWLFRSVHDLEAGSELASLLTVAYDSGNVTPLFEFLAHRAYEKGFISDTDDYLDHHREELLFKAEASKMQDEELVTKIARIEFDAFDKVKNEGGRASCQNDWYTFSIMRESQYMTWERPMLLQYYYDFTRELSYGHNLITEKYGRMMESTAPEKYEEIKDNFPPLSPEKKSIIEAIVGIQVGWMHNFTEKYPKLGDRSRSVDTFDDNAGNTSYETYLRGEISTYSDKMLQLYAAFVVKLTKEGRNLAFETMQNSVLLYGYDSLEDAEKKV